MPKIVDHDQRRSELLAKCLGVFAEKGYAAVTTRELERVTGVSTGILYHYFASKEDLFSRLVRFFVERVTSELADTVVKGQNPEARLALIMRYLDTKEDEFSSYLLVLTDYARCVGIERFREELDFHRAEAALLELLSSSLEMSPDQARRTLTHLMGLLITRFLTGKNGPLADEISLMIR
ncbi:MAG TPA: TetR/AcrR family transcriptional regulator [Candidatus Hydrogenedentes bacterium]|nr:TetR/AcrR family transcriptional regulator [Candidatus Hydrogenedentota bacterium]